ncbi:MAG TPA: DUF3127 domain-containing protein [Bacteroidia bacterium]|jgi:hypothetical protein|nr:DUF3127 domain-containing protein [Bacteroidia bacterium]
MNFELTGTLKLKKDEQKVSDTFKKREFVVTDNSGNSNYPQHILFQLKQDKCRILDNFNPGDEVKVTFNISGREWQKDGVVKYFTSLDAWRVDGVEKGSSSSGSQETSYATEAALPATEEQDDLPF